jgi:hypothetical protein
MMERLARGWDGVYSYGRVRFNGKTSSPTPAQVMQVYIIYKREGIEALMGGMSERKRAVNIPGNFICDEEQIRS